MQINYINLLNNLILSLKSNPINSLEVLSNESYLNSLIKEILPNFENKDTVYSSELKSDEDKNTNNFMSLLSSIEEYSNKSKIKDNFTQETNFSKTISIKDLINKKINELIKISEMLIFLTMISNNKNYYIEKINEIEDNKLSKLYYNIIEKYISFKIDESSIIIKNIKKEKELNNTNDIILNQKFNIKPIKISKTNFNILAKDIKQLEQKEQEKNINKELIIQNQINFCIDKIQTKSAINTDNEIIINQLQKENDELNKIINSLSLEKKELENVIKNSDTKIKEIELDYEKLKDEFELKEQNAAEIISNNKSMIEKLNHDLKLAIKENKKMNEEKDILINELNKYKEDFDKYKENDKKKLKEKTALNEKEKEEELNFYKKSYEEQKIRVNEEHKLISESLYKLAVHFMTLKDDLQNRINLAKNNK